MSAVSEFLARQPVRPGKLGEWQAEIIELRQTGASLMTICRFLAEQGVTAKSGEVHRFLHRCGRQDQIKRSARKPVNSTSPEQTKRPGLPKFEWKPGKPETPW
ncbi:hypothetical protein [Pseudoduganella umbonata]|uniref:Transposase n=1 Tax=Pseudoduganella umbonata TaxID=864828 RepID=A0A4P8HLG3_9BURK|nr:hypothetical protein [Pseudoduganella umbonata]MBB3221665.1 transposase [Pseudoduganella umbonata]QCP09108.1 hypothetical protein FCL38_00635 [Pseudoduganella umbonata]